MPLSVYLGVLEHGKITVIEMERLALQVIE